MSEATCENCGKKYTPHKAYRNKTQACDGPNGYCAGVIDGREDIRAELSEMKGWAKAEESLADDLHAERNDLLELLLRCRPFVWRAMQGGKSPHAQDKEDAQALWPLIKGLER